jgi:hypothetical protein
MKATDYIFINNYNKTLPFGLEYYTETNRVLGVEYIGFATIGEAIQFIENSDLSFYKQK